MAYDPEEINKHNYDKFIKTFILYFCLAVIVITGCTYSIMSVLYTHPNIGFALHCDITHVGN